MSSNSVVQLFFARVSLAAREIKLHFQQQDLPPTLFVLKADNEVAIADVHQHFASEDTKQTFITHELPKIINTYPGAQAVALMVESRFRSIPVNKQSASLGEALAAADQYSTKDAVVVHLKTCKGLEFTSITPYALTPTQIELEDSFVSGCSSSRLLSSVFVTASDSAKLH